MRTLWLVVAGLICMQALAGEAVSLNVRFTGAVEAPAGVWTIESADLDMDGTVEFVLGCVDNTVYALAPDGRQLWGHKTGALPYSIATGDLTGDGKPETVVSVAATPPALEVLGPDGRLLQRVRMPTVVLDMAIACRAGGPVG